MRRKEWKRSAFNRVSILNSSWPKFPAFFGYARFSGKKWRETISFFEPAATPLFDPIKVEYFDSLEGKVSLETISMQQKKEDRMREIWTLSLFPPLASTNSVRSFLQSISPTKHGVQVDHRVFCLSGSWIWCCNPHHDAGMVLEESALQWHRFGQSIQ